ncbi:MAG: hypothetical protein PVF58_19505 [Candidatus Methanofastidiosia archaeon]|jgi:hypothetical protein
MGISTGYIISYAIAIVAVLSLSVYFFREYSKKKLRALLAWSFGFLFYGITQIAHLSADMFGDVSMGKLGFGLGMAVLVLAVTLFYYGTSLLFFDERSFLREKMSLIILLIYSVYSAIILAVLPIEGFVKSVAAPLSLGVMLPMFIVIGAPFYLTSRRISQGDIRKRVLLLLATGWFLVAVCSAYLGTLLGLSLVTDSLVYILQVVAWALIWYGMVIGKAARI